MTLLWALLGFLVAMILLVAIHEMGHFLVARACGVKVLRFSVGFGKPLLRWRDPSQCEYVVAAIPLGGYVQMLDENEGPVATEQVGKAFNRQSLWARVCIVLAGPVFNLLLAVLLYFTIFVVGVDHVVPLIGSVITESPAAKAGMQSGQVVTSFAGIATPDWQALRMAMLKHLGEQHVVLLTTEDRHTKQRNEYRIPLATVVINQRDPQPLLSLGLQPMIPSIPPIIGSVIAEFPAAKAGLRKGDRILAINEQPVKDWNELIKYIRVHTTKITLQVQRQEQQLTLTLQPQSVIGSDGESKPMLGVLPAEFSWPKELIYTERYSLLSAWQPAIQQTVSTTLMTYRLFGKLFTGQLALHTVSGPVGIAVSAGQTIQMGWLSYLHFLALVSISLAVLNLLPIPVLDGGYLLFFLIEALRKRPVSITTQLMLTKICFTGLLALTMFAFYNDLLRLWS